MTELTAAVKLKEGDHLLLKGMPKGKRIWWKPWQRKPDANGTYVVTRTMGGHRVKVSIERDVTTFVWRCEEPVGSVCRIRCECEMNVPDPNDEEICTWCESRVVQVDYCNLITWFEEGGTGEEQYGGAPLVLLDAEIEAVWEGDYYTWKVKP
jgi:hypothetical protein